MEAVRRLVKAQGEMISNCERVQVVRVADLNSPPLDLNDEGVSRFREQRLIA